MSSMLSSLVDPVTSRVAATVIITAIMMSCVRIDPISVFVRSSASSWPGVILFAATADCWK